MPWRDKVLAIEPTALDGALATVKSFAPEAISRMRNGTFEMLQRLLYTTFEFSGLATRAVGCVGCAPHRADCDKHPPPRLPPAHRARLGPSARELKMGMPTAGGGGGDGAAASTAGGSSLERAICGQTSYFGEDGSLDAFEGLMATLKQRATPPRAEQHAPAEPWMTKAGMTTSARGLFLRAWFEARADYYRNLVVTEQPTHTILRGASPAYAHRRALSKVVQGGPF